MTYGESNGHVTDDVTSLGPESSSHHPNTLNAQYLGNIWRCYLAKIANYYGAYVVCCDAVWSAILATAWLLVLVPLSARSAIYTSRTVGLRRDSACDIVFSKLHTRASLMNCRQSYD